MNSISSAQEQFKKDRGLIKVKAVHNPRYKRHGTKSYIHLLLKYNFEPTKGGPYFRINRPKHKDLVSEKIKAVFNRSASPERVLVKKTSSDPGAKYGDVTAEDTQNDSLYLCKASIGTPYQSLMLDFDTGSADLWVFSAALSSSQTKGHNVFNPNKSSTYRSLSGKTWKIEYGDGSNASGDCGTDTLVVGGLSVEKQTIEIAGKLSEQFVSNTGDGLLGLAFGKLNTVQDNGTADPQATPVENMIEQNDIPKEAELFTSAFYSSRDGVTARSFYTFGFIDQDLVKKSGEEIHWIEVDKSDGFWAFLSESVSINGESIPTGSNAAIADTGTTLALMSDDVVDALYEQIPGATYDWSSQGYIFPINITVEDLPVFKVAVGDKLFLIQKEDLAFAPTDDGEYWYGGVQSRGSLSFDILGDTFLKSVYVIWDQGNTRLGVVPKLEETQNLKTPPTAGSRSDENEKGVTSITMAAADRIDPARGSPLDSGALSSRLT